MLRRCMLLSLGLSLLLALVGGPAGAQSVAEVAEALEFRGYYVAPGADDDVDLDDMEALAARVAQDESRIFVVVLAREPSGDGDLFANDVRESLGAEATVLVVTPETVNAVSNLYDPADVDRAVLRAETAGGNASDLAEVFVDELSGGETSAGTTTTTDGSASAAAEGDGAGEADSDGGGGGGGLVVLVVLLVIVGAIVAFFLFARKKAKARNTGEVESARAEIRAQLEAVAREIVDDQERIQLSGNEQAIAWYREANATYTQVSDVLDSTTNLLELAALNDRIDRARWQLDAAEAVSEGRPVPPEPTPDAPSACFFDPTHRPGTEEAVIRTEAGNKEVKVCRSCADKLRRGEQPEPRMINVGGRRVPAATAPRSHGGGGLGGLGVFEVLLGTLGGLGSLGGGGGGRGRSGGGGLNIDWGGFGSSGGRRRSTSSGRSGRQSSAGGRPSGGGVFGSSTSSSSPRPSSSSARPPKQGAPRARSRRRRR